MIKTAIPIAVGIIAQQVAATKGATILAKVPAIPANVSSALVGIAAGLLVKKFMG